MNSTSDQAIAISPQPAIISAIVFTNPSTALTTAVGGIYGAAGKTGFQYVAAAQTYAGLVNPTDVLYLSGSINLLNASTIFLSLTVPQGGAATADIYVIGTAI